MNPIPQQLRNEHWIAFLNATKGSKIHRVLDGVLCGFLFVGIFGGALAGFILNQYFESDNLFVWGLGFSLIGLYGSFFAFIPVRCRVLDRAFRRYLANLESTRQSQTG
jgi:hypothetical protein